MRELTDAELDAVADRVADRLDDQPATSGITRRQLLTIAGGGSAAVAVEFC